MALIIRNISPKVNRKYKTYDIIVKFAQNSGSQIMHYYERIRELRQDRDKTQYPQTMCLDCPRALNGHANGYISYKMPLVQM